MKTVNRIIGLSAIVVFGGSQVMGQTTADAKKTIDAELYQKAISSLKALTAATPAVGENYFWLGEAYLKNDYPDSAKAVFQKGTTADPKFSLNYVGLGAVELENNNPDGAKANFATALTMATNKKDNRPNLYIGKAYSEASVPNFKAAIPYLDAAVLTNPKDAEAALAIGIAHRGAGDNSAAYSDFTKALELDKNLSRAKLELAVTIKLAKAFKEANDKFNELILADPNYGPAYRELAETNYQWFNSTNKPEETDNAIKMAVKAYEQYMDHTDHSVEKRLKHADYLFNEKDYKGLEAEANEMAKMDKANLRTLRYLGYSAFENGNYPSTVQSLKEFIAKVEPRRIIPRDYLYLGKAQLKTGEVDDAINTFKTAIKMDSTIAGNMSAIAQEFYSTAKYDKAIAFFELALLDPKSKTLLNDNLKIALANYFDYRAKFQANLSPSKDILVKADSAFSTVNKKAPTYELAYLYRARISRLMDEEAALKGAMIPYLEKYVEIVEPKIAATPLTAQGKKDLIDAYNNLGAFYAPTDKVKAKTFWDKTVALDPADDYATKSLAALGAVSSTTQTPPK